jgi:uncharacterized membrane protein YdjX (TVP38/TMEM64 family)
VPGQPPAAPPQPRLAGHPVFRFVLLVGLIAGLAAVTLGAGPDRAELLEALRHSDVFAPVAAVLGSAVLCAALVPRTLLALVGGALFGATGGTAYTLVGVTLGAMLAYGLGRLLGRDFVSARLRGRFALVEQAVARRGLVAVIVARLIPAVPFGISNYAFGTTSVRPARFAVGTFLGALPATVAYAALGSATAHGDNVGAGVAGCGVGALGVVGVVGTYLVWRRRPRKAPALPAGRG